MKLPKTPPATGEPSKPKSRWDTVITATPVAMTVLATILAGLSSSEISQAQYYRSLSAQNQSKAGDQWGLFQAKKMRGATAGNSVELLVNLGEVGPFYPGSFADVAARLAATPPSDLADAEMVSALAALSAGDPPEAPAKPIGDAAVRKAMEDVASDAIANDESMLFLNLKDQSIADAFGTASANARASDEALKPVLNGTAKAQGILNLLLSQAHSAPRNPNGPSTRSATGPASTHAMLMTGAHDRGIPVELRRLMADFTAARLRFDAVRYDREAKLNQQTAYLYEVLVRKTSLQSERHRVRSKYFFYGMLAAQAAVMIATFSLAVRERSWMWSLAAAIGVAAISYAGYVYLTV